MRVCWDAEVGVRAPCGALSGQDSGFLPISRMITGLPDAAPAAGSLGLGALDREPEAQVVGQPHRHGAGDPRLALGGPEIREVERPRCSTSPEGLARDDS